MAEIGTPTATGAPRGEDPDNERASDDDFYDDFPEVKR